jgi:hypothetical protein
VTDNLAQIEDDALVDEGQNPFPDALASRIDDAGTQRCSLDGQDPHVSNVGKSDLP